MIFTGITGLNAAQTALNVTSKNIAGVGVNGYSRQVANFKTSDIGGVYINNIERVSDQYAVQQAWFNATQYGYDTTNASHNLQLETLVSGKNTSLSPSLNGFFDTLNAASADPMEIAYRQEVLADAEDLASRFNSLSSSMNKQAADVESQLSSLTGEANDMLASIAKTNEAIAAAAAIGNVPSHLLDERDQSIQQLSELMDVSIIFEQDQTATVTIPTGEPLVSRGETNELVLLPGYPDASQTQLAVKSHDATKRIDQPGGGIGGLMDFREDTLSQSQRELDRLALAFSNEVNALMEKGFDLNGAAGSALFGDINSSELMRNRSTHIGGTNSVNLDIKVDDTSKLTADNYVFSKNDKNELEVHRHPGGEKVDFETDTTTGDISFDGITISAADGKTLGDMAAGSSYLIEPGKGAAGTMEVVLDDPEKLAFSGKADEPGNNSNLLDLIKLQDKTIAGGQSVNQGWNSIISDVASSSARATNSLAASEMLYQEATSRVQSESGVNLDEEAGNMLMFQQLYSANAKVISTADELFQTLLQAV
ncbi:flagellar hook-associated protein FlgK [Parendozoicomonas haliclonae]|uniref:Flagellar hook-associated protein 1 n=2 Tax=Parendozoicomonas haliclonae TaxID=1960125 RepID=A0A1X7ANK0_9GAMM|nr:Flagellar hook-associated protein 1 [Parendozoicomonas haliclonae]